jgi:chromosome segregation ATPase
MGENGNGRLTGREAANWITTLGSAGGLLIAVIALWNTSSSRASEEAGQIAALSERIAGLQDRISDDALGQERQLEEIGKRIDDLGKRIDAIDEQKNINTTEIGKLTSQYLQLQDQQDRWFAEFEKEYDRITSEFQENRDQMKPNLGSKQPSLEWHPPGR